MVFSESDGPARCIEEYSVFQLATLHSVTHTYVNGRRTDCYDGNGRFIGWCDGTETHSAEWVRLIVDRLLGVVWVGRKLDLDT